MRRRRRTAWHIAAGGDKPFTITFLTGTFPEAITLGASYTGPADASLAEYDAGDGVWQTYTSKTITRNGEYIAFRGDWRDSLGRYAHMFAFSFQSTAYTCKFSGMLEVTPDVVNDVYRETFRDNTAVVSIEDNPLPRLSGTPSTFMYYATYYLMNGVQGALPSRFMDTSGLTGVPAANMFNFACNGMSGVTSLPAGFMDTSGLEGAPAANMFSRACENMTSVTSLPAGFMDTSGLFGTPAGGMFNQACQNMSQVTSLPAGFMDTSNMDGAPAAGMFQQACNGMSQVTSLPVGFMDTSGLFGTPAANMFNFACSGMTGLTDAYVFHLGAGITFTAANVFGPLNNAFRNMGQWSGQVMWGTNVLVEAIPEPDSRTFTFLSSTNMPNYDTIDANWK